MDPQSRILLEESFKAISDAQAGFGSLVDTRTGVYVGCMYQEFTQLQYNLGYKIRFTLQTSPLLRNRRENENTNYMVSTRCLGRRVSCHCHV